MTAQHEYVVSSLDTDVEILLDRWGVPHVYAASRRDVYIAQGFNAARDRLFQIDLWRRRGNGRLAEVLGGAYVEQDRANRLLAYRGDLDREWESYGQQARQVVEWFVAGVNAYVGWVGDDSDRLPPEFGVHGYLPGLWEAADAVRFRTHGLFYNVEQELARSLTLRDVGSEGEHVRQAREPADPLTVPDGTDLSWLSQEAVRVYRLAFAPVDFGGAADPASSRLATSGSNNWVIGAERSSTGRPILANDPHRAVTLPSLRYLAHLEAPGLSVIGAGEPGLPGISIGHNGKIAFGLTIWPADQEDLYLYELDPADPSRYRYDGAWESMRVVEESIAVAGGQDVVVRLAFTRHGPVLSIDDEKGVALGLRAAWLEPGMAPYLGSLSYQDARDGDEFVTALDHWGAPGVNQVYATPDGDFGWQAAAKVPRRRGWDGSVPVPGDGRYEWDGFVTASELPSSRRPAAGWLATANEMNLPDDHDNQRSTVTYDWYSSARAERLRDVLSDDTATFDVQSSLRLQRDDVSVHACRVVAALGEGLAASVDLPPELVELLAWDGATGAASRETLVFEIWVRRHLRPWLVRFVLTDEGLDAAAVEAGVPLVLKDESFGGDLRGDLRMLTRVLALPRQRWLAGVLETFAAAIQEIEQRLGVDRDDWAWGRLHHSEVVHPALVHDATVPEEWVRIGPVPRGGTGDTVGMAGYDGQFRQSIGSTFAMVVDVGDWDASVATNAPGQSGDPRSEHYGDLFGPWSRGEAFPLVYSRASVEAATATRIVLRST